MADQTQRLETLGIARMNDNDDTPATDYGVRCPRCGYEDDGYTYDEAHSEARRHGCPDCVVPTDDLAADEGETGEMLTDVSNPLAVTRP